VAFEVDHIVIIVHDLEQAIEDYRALGFVTHYGGEHADGKTHNALIVFRDGTYLELLAPTRPTLLQELDPRDRSNFLFLLAGGEGFGGYALISEKLEEDIAKLIQNEVPVELKPPAGRNRPDAVQLQWRTGMLQSGSMTPFFIQDITPRELRVPITTEWTNHPNDAIGIREITISTSHLKEAQILYRASGADEILNNGKQITYNLKSNIIKLVTKPEGDDQIQSITITARSSISLNTELTHQALIQLSAE